MFLPDACKLNNWKKSLRGIGTHQCSEQIQAFLDEHLPTWRDRNGAGGRKRNRGARQAGVGEDEEGDSGRGVRRMRVEGRGESDGLLLGGEGGLLGGGLSLDTRGGGDGSGLLELEEDMRLRQHLLQSPSHSHSGQEGSSSMAGPGEGEGEGLVGMMDEGGEDLSGLTAQI